MDWTTAPGLSTQGPLPPRREIWVVILLGIFTLGIYALYWLYVTYRDTHQHLGRPHKAQAALVLGIVAYVILWVAMIMYMVAAFGTAFSGSRGEPEPFAIGGMLAAMGFMFLASFAVAGIQVWMIWGAARGTEMVLERYGRKPDVPPILHALLPIIINVWVYVAMALIQNDLNKLHEPTQQQAYGAYPQG